MDEGKPEKALRIAGNNPRHVAVGLEISAGKRGKDHGSIDASLLCTLEIFVEWGGGVGRLR
jgi:hypothetical protein